MYLWHQIVFRWVATWPFIPHPPDVTRGDPAWAWIVTLSGFAIALGIASFVTYAIERPLLANGSPELDLSKGRSSPARMSASEWVHKAAAASQ